MTSIIWQWQGSEITQNQHNFSAYQHSTKKNKNKNKKPEKQKKKQKKKHIKNKTKTKQKWILKKENNKINLLTNKIPNFTLKK